MIFFKRSFSSSGSSDSSHISSHRGVGLTRLWISLDAVGRDMPQVSANFIFAEVHFLAVHSQSKLFFVGRHIGIYRKQIIGRRKCIFSWTLGGFKQWKIFQVHIGIVSKSISFVRFFESAGKHISHINIGGSEYCHLFSFFPATAWALNIASATFTLSIRTVSLPCLSSCTNYSYFIPFQVQLRLWCRERCRKCSNDGYFVWVTLSMAWMLCILAVYLKGTYGDVKTCALL